MKRSWLRIVVAGLCAGALVGLLLPTLSAAAGTHKQPACAHQNAGTRKQAACAHRKTTRHKKAKHHKKTSGRHKKAAVAACPVSPVGSVCPAAWMHDLADYLGGRDLSDIVIPGSHDTGTYALADDPVDLIGKAQTEDITAQLNDGAREFDLRAGWFEPQPPGGYYMHHGILMSFSLSLKQMLDQIAQWTRQPGHEQEIILFTLSIDGDGPFPTQTCQDFARVLGSALLTPNELKAHFGTDDPGQVTLGQLWSMPGHPRVLMDNNQCMDAGDPSAGQWPDNLLGGYYANQCYADPYSYFDFVNWFQEFHYPGIAPMDLAAAKTRASYGGGDDNIPGNPVLLGPPKRGGLWDLGVEATPTLPCLRSLGDFDLAEQEKVLARLYQQWLSDPDTQANLNLVSGDFVQDSQLVKDAIEMDGPGPTRADNIDPLTPDRVVVDLGWEHTIGVGSFAVEARNQGVPVWRQLVKWSVSPADNNPYSGADGPNFDGGTTFTNVTDRGGDAVLPTMSAGSHVGTWILTASIPGASTKTTWTIVVDRNDPYRLSTIAPSGQPYNPATVPVNGTISGGLKVQVLTTTPEPSGVAGRQVTFDVRSVVGRFADGSKTATVTTADGPYGQGVAISPPFQARTLAGPTSISVSSPGAATQSIPLTVTAGPAARFIAGHSNQTVPVGGTFALLDGSWFDQYGNRTADVPPDDRTLTVSPASGAMWPNGQSTIEVTPRADGTISTPDLTAGHTALEGPQQDRSLIIMVGSKVGWWLYVSPGPAADVTATGGNGQHTGASQPFANPLVVKVTDAWGNAISGAPVTFNVTSGGATFPPVNLRLLAALTGHRGRLNLRDPARDSVIVPTDANGMATAPVTAGPNPGKIVVTASANGAQAATQAVFHLSATAVAPTAPTITNLGNGDGQVTVGFSGATAGTSPIASYEVSAQNETDTTAPAVTAKGLSSPITVTGLVNGDTYVFTVTATSADGTSPPSPQSGRLNVGVAPVVLSGPADGTVGHAYASGFEFTGAPAPNVTLYAGGGLPPGLTLSGDGKVTGTPTQAGTYTFTVQADNHVGTIDVTVPVTISPAALGGPPPAANGREVHASICPSPTSGDEGKPVCASRTLIGPLPPLATNATATLVRGTVTYAGGHATAHYRMLTLQRRHRMPAGRYTLILRHGHRAIIVPVELR
jgi:Fibronectin type III domain